MHLVLHQDEKIIDIFRRYGLTYFWSYFLVFLFIVAPFFFMFVLFSWGNWGLGIFAASVIIGLILFFRTLYFQRSNSLVVTSERVVSIEQKGLLNKVVVDLNYSNIQNISFQIKGVLPTIFRYGTIKLKTAGQGEDLYFKALKKPAVASEVISRTKETSRRNSVGEQVASVPDKIASIFGLIEQLSAEELESFKKSFTSFLNKSK